ncbi:MAG: DUF2946 family protein [Burkholderiaceae bacterium]
MRVPRPFLPLLLALLLLFSQQAGFVHALSHLGDRQAGDVSVGTNNGNDSGNDIGAAPVKKAPAGHVCEQCLSFAQIGAALPPSAPCLPVDRAVDAAILLLVSTPAGARLLRAFWSRAPPR